jgi:ribosomal biogenesis protein LAS1
VLIKCIRRKRVFSSDSFAPPKDSISLWTPLLKHLQSYHQDLPSTLANHIISHLVTGHQKLDTLIDCDQETVDAARRDESFDMCIARWAWWIVDSWAVEDDDPDLNLRKDIVVTLITSLGPDPSGVAVDKKASVSAI